MLLGFGTDSVPTRFAVGRIQAAAANRQLPVRFVTDVIGPPDTALGEALFEPRPASNTSDARSEQRGDAVTTASSMPGPSRSTTVTEISAAALGCTAADEVIVSSTINLGHALHLKVVAEGVEEARPPRKASTPLSPPL